MRVWNKRFASIDPKCLKTFKLTICVLEIKVDLEVRLRRDPLMDGIGVCKKEN